MHTAEHNAGRGVSLASVKLGRVVGRGMRLPQDLHPYFVTASLGIVRHRGALTLYKNRTLSRAPCEGRHCE